jgi:DNA-binding beta-propeller fold protein YncE
MRDGTGGRHAREPAEALTDRRRLGVIAGERLQETPMLALAAVALAASMDASRPGPGLASPRSRVPVAAVEAVVYATRGDNRIHILSGEDLTPLASIDAGLGAHETALSCSGRWLIGSAYGGPGPGHQPADNRMVVIDVPSQQISTTVTLPGMTRPNDLAFLPGSARAVVTVEQPPSVVRVDASTGKFDTLPASRPAGHMLALSPLSDVVHLAHVMPGSMTTLDLATGKTIGTVELKPGAEGIAAAPDGVRVWVACGRSDAIAIVDVREHKVARWLDCPGFPHRIRISPDGVWAAVACPKSGEVALYDSIAPEKVHRVRVGGPGAAPTGVAFLPSGRRLAVLLSGPAAQIVLLDVESREVVARVDALGPGADALSAGRAQAVRLM